MGTLADGVDRVLGKLHHIPQGGIIRRITGDFDGVAGRHHLVGVVQAGDIGEMGAGTAELRRQLVHPGHERGLTARDGHGHGQGSVGGCRDHGGGQQIPQRPGLAERHVAVAKAGARDGGIEHLERIRPLYSVQVKRLLLDRLHGIGPHHHPHQRTGGIGQVGLLLIQDDVVRGSGAQINQHGRRGFHPVALRLGIGIEDLSGGRNRQNPH